MSSDKCTRDEGTEDEREGDSLSMRTLQRMRKERDEALTRVAALEKQVAFDVRVRLEVESVLDEALGTEPVFGAGHGLASDVRLLMAQRDAARAARLAGEDDRHG